MPVLKHAILSTLVYYDLLDRPLTELEIYRYLLAFSQKVEPRRRESAALLYSVAGRNPAPKAIHDDRSPASETRWPSGARVSFFDFTQTLAEIVRTKKIECHQGLYFLPDHTNLSQAGQQICHAGLDPASKIRKNLDSRFRGNDKIDIIKIREERLKLAQLKWKKLKKLARWLALVPFLRLAAVTGSLTAYNTRQDSDFDLLIVAKNGRLWLTRTLITALTSLMRARRHDQFTQDRICLNCYLTQEGLEIKPEAKPRDFHSAQEYGRLTPILEIEKGLYQKFLQKNSWLNQYLNFFPWTVEETAKKIKINRGLSSIRKAGERLLAGEAGDWLEKKLGAWQTQRINQKLQTEPADQIYISQQCLMFHPHSKSYRLLRAWQIKINALTNQ